MNEPDRAAASDEELLSRARGHSEAAARAAAASELFGRYRKRVYLWCFRYVHDHDRALDLAQDALLSAWRALDSFEDRSRFSSWLFAIARNRCLSAVRPVSLSRDPEVEPDDLYDAAPGPERGLEERQDEERLIELMRAVLDENERQALSLRCFERLSVDEITRMLSIEGASGARGVLQSARRKLRAALARRAEEEAGS